MPAGRPNAAPSNDQDDQLQFDLTPWVETPNSTRVSRFRYDFANRALQVQWTNAKNHGYVYRDVDYENYRSFARVVSKGKHVNRVLNGFDYELMDTDEVQAPSSASRKAITSRLRS